MSYVPADCSCWLADPALKEYLYSLGGRGPCGQRKAVQTKCQAKPVGRFSLSIGFSWGRVSPRDFAEVVCSGRARSRVAFALPVVGSVPAFAFACCCAAVTGQACAARSRRAQRAANSLLRHFPTTGAEMSYLTRCLACGAVWTDTHSAWRDLTTCPECGSGDTEEFEVEDDEEDPV